MCEKKVIDLSFELRREFALGNVGKYIPNLVHLIPTITKYKPQKRKNGKFCFGCFALEMDKLCLADTNVDENWIESKKDDILKILNKVSIFCDKFLENRISRVTFLPSVTAKLRINT